MKSNPRRSTLAAAIASRATLLLGSVLVVLPAACNRSAPAAPPAPPPVEVTVQTVKAERVAVTTDLPGRIDAVRVAEVRARVPGILLKRLFQEGADVKAGDKLFEIDPAQFQANYASAQANLAKAEANEKQARALAERARSLVEAEAVSKQEYDNAEAAAAQAAAEVQAVKAALSNSGLSLGYATVTAPIDGRIGRALVTEGALVGQNESTPLATIQQLDPVYFDFTQSSTDLLRLRRAVAAGTVKTIEPGTAEVTLLLEDGSQYSHPGKLLFSDISVDPSTGMVTLRAEFPNPDRLLLPGMFARGRVEQAVNEQAITVPQRAVARSAGGAATALVVGSDNKVEARVIELGDAVGDKWVVTKGLQSGDRIIVEGLQKARPGAVVKPVEVGSPVEPAPAAANSAQK
ncbi:MAG: efflux RND transporter periplasmic adaptor subunit [Opitutus sp.]